MSKLLSSLEIARKAKPHQIHAIANSAGIKADEIEPYGSYKAKVSLKVLERLAARPHGKLICVTGMTPTKEGDGKTTTCIGLTQALGLLKKKVFLCLREPSLSPIFGSKGGASGNGYSQVVPFEDINLHFTGDSHAVSTAHNLLAAVIENHIHHGNSLGIDKNEILWRRVMDLSDRQLREISVGHAKACNLSKHKTGFDVTASSEVMAALSLSQSIHSLKNKLSKISTALSLDKKLITAKDLKAAGAMTLLLKDAIKPNLVQTLEGQPVFMHTGPFANVSHGNNSVLSTTMALKLANYVVTESGFATELGMEKLFNIVAREGGFKPSVVVLVVTIKAIKSHASENASPKKFIDLFKEGFANIERHIQNIHRFGIHAVVAINRFPQDTDEEIKFVRDYLQSENVDCAVSEVAARGGEGGVELAEKVLKVIAEKPGNFHPLYSLDLGPEEKIEKIAREMYGADGVIYSDKAKTDLELIHRHKLGNLPVNIAKTPYSLSDDSRLKGAPTGWKLKVGEIRPFTGAGYLVAICGKLMLMPGLPAKPILEDMDLTDEGEAKGIA